MKLSSQEYLELHCEATESIRSTTLRFEYEAPNIELVAKLRNETNEVVTYISETITGLESNQLTVSKKYMLTNSENPADTKEVTILLSKAQKNNTSGNQNVEMYYYMQIITGEDLVSSNGKTEYQVYLLDFVETIQFSTHDPNQTDTPKVYLNKIENKSYYLGFTGSYCFNTTQMVGITYTDSVGNSIPILGYTIGDNFSEGNEIIIETEE